MSPTIALSIFSAVRLCNFCAIYLAGSRAGQEDALWQQQTDAGDFCETNSLNSHEFSSLGGIERGKMAALWVNSC